MRKQVLWMRDLRQNYPNIPIFSSFTTLKYIHCIIFPKCGIKTTGEENYFLGEALPP
jgi:hypothetical protein